MFCETTPEMSTPTAEELELEIEQLAHQRRVARGLRTAARRALVLARRYREEEGPQGRRETACVTQALAWRTAARELRQPTFGLGPGLARTAGQSAVTSGRRAG